MPPKSDSRRRRRTRTPREEKEFEEYMLQLDRVTRVVKGGRRMRFRATVIIGDRAGRVGIGLGKGNDVQIAARKAAVNAKKNLIEVPIVNDTITHPLKLKFKAARIIVLPAAPGTGLIAGSAIRKVLELAGVKNVLSKNIGTSNRVVVGQATLKLLAELRVTEASKKFTEKLKKEKDELKKKIAAKRQNTDRTGRKKRYPTSTSAPKSELKEAAEKIEKTKGRLEEEQETQEVKKKD